MENIKLLLQLWFRPVSAISEIMDKGSWLIAAVFVLLVSIPFYFTINAKIQTAYGVPTFNFETYNQFQTAPLSEDEEDAQYETAWNNYQKALRERQQIPLIGDYLFWFFSFQPNRFYIPLISTLLFYLPTTILLVSIFAHIGRFDTLFSRNYGMLATCSLLAWTASHLPFAIIGILLYSQILNPQIYLAFWLVSGLWFGVLMVFAVRTVFGIDYGKAILSIGLSWLGFSLGIYIFRFVSPILFSPFILIFAYLYFGGYLASEARGFGNAFRQRQNFKRYLQNALINPKDSDAHVQLGLIYKQRRQTEKALEHFSKAVEIEPTEIDGNYELGKLARERGEFQKAIDYFAIVVEQNEKYSLNEIWREIGATYLSANMFAEAENALETFVERRPFDAEGLYHFGKTLKALGKTEEAREMFKQCVETATTSPDYRKYEQRKWANLAKKELK